MGSLMGADKGNIWIVLFSVVVGTAFLAAIFGVFYVWKQRLIENQQPLPQCDLQKRLSQIAQASVRYPEIV